MTGDGRGALERARLGVMILCGGAGTRLWPLSRRDRPKQFLPLGTGETLLHDTIERLAPLREACAQMRVELIGGVAQEKELETFLSGEAPLADGLLLEPCARNTAAAVAMAALRIEAEMGADADLLILPSDHLVSPSETFRDDVAEALAAAASGDIVTFGIQPDYPATGYGYIEAATDEKVSRVSRFVEKPDRSTAARYLEQKRFLWNAGMFASRAGVMLRALHEHAPDILAASRIAFEASRSDGPSLRPGADDYAAIRAQSIDYAVMEHCDHISVVRAAFGWSDIGSFRALHDVGAKDAKGNVFTGPGVALESADNLLFSTGPMIAGYGLDRMAVVATPDAVFVAPLSHAEDVKHLVTRLEGERSDLLARSAAPAPAVSSGVSISATLRGWLFDEALPFWAQAGVDTRHGGFHEVLDFGGATTGADKRMRTMARQIFVYARASRMGWDGDSAAVVEHGLDFMRTVESQTFDGWPKTLSAEGDILDTTVDLYDHAFIALALAEVRAAGLAEVDDLTARVENVFASLRRKDGRGYAEDDRGTLPRRANPHMHLLEASLAAAGLGDETARARVDEMRSLFATHFFDGESLRVREHLTDELGRPGTGWGPIEPGHAMEWSWLLHESGKFAGPSDGMGLALVAGARAFGSNPSTGLLYDALGRDGVPLHRSSRCWPQTEALRAAIALARQGRAEEESESERLARLLHRHFIEPAPSGLWNDVCDASGAAISDTVPASTFYHLIGAIDDHLRFAEER